MWHRVGWGMAAADSGSLEIPAPVEVTEHVFVTRVCPVCERRRTPKTDLGVG